MTINNPQKIVADIRNPKALKVNAERILFGVQIIWLALIDSLAIALAWTIARKIGTPINNYSIWQPNQKELGFFWLIIPIHLCIMMASGIYRTEEKSHSQIKLFKAISLAQITILLIIFLLQPGIWISRSAFIIAWILTFSLLSSEKALLAIIMTNLKSTFSSFRRKVLLLGTLEDNQKAKQLINSSKAFKIQATADLSICQDSKKWEAILTRSGIYKFDEIFLCSWDKVENPIYLLWELKSAGINWRIVDVNLKLPQQWSEIVVVQGMPTIRFYSSMIVGVDFWCKRIFDLSISSLLLLILALPMLLIAMVIKLDSDGSVFYRQNRVGLKGCQFRVWKFRTMVKNASELQPALEFKNEVAGGILFKIKEDPRITRVGRFLRRYSLDELPQLINVLRGEMSLVGPRPLPLRDVAKLAPCQLLRHEILPGITGLWQVSGRSDTDSEEIFNLDFIYIQNWSLILDFQILLKTIQVVIRSKGAY